MTEGTSVEKSLVDQILDEMFSKIEGRSEFDARTVQRLRDLAARGDLKRAAQVTLAIKSEGGLDHESA